MFIIETYSTAVVFCFITMICWGSWANAQKLAAANWRFELFYWDYVIGILLLSLLFALTMGNTGEGGRSFIADWQQANPASIQSAVVGGIIFNAANILLGAAIALAGMSVAFPVGIGLALVIGVIVNYLDSPLGNGPLLFGGVSLVAVAILLNAWAYRKRGQTSKASSKGIILSIVSGCLMGLFYKYVAASMFPDFHIPEPGKLSPYTAVLFFSFGIVASNFLFNTLLMKWPSTGTSLTYREYFGGTFKNHLTGILGGMIWCVGMSFSIIASGKAGPAISYGLGQGATVVAALWGIYIWKEFRDVPGTRGLLNAMLVCYALGLALIITAR